MKNARTETKLSSPCSAQEISWPNSFSFSTEFGGPLTTGPANEDESRTRRRDATRGRLLQASPSLLLGKARSLSSPLHPFSCLWRLLCRLLDSFGFASKSVSVQRGHLRGLSNQNRVFMELKIFVLLRKLLRRRKLQLEEKEKKVYSTEELSKCFA